MFRYRLINLLINPYVFSLLISFPILWILLPDASKYELQKIERLRTNGSISIFYSDLDGDGNSEEVNIDVTSKLLKITLYNESKLIDQHNLQSRPIEGEYFYEGDYNNDGNNELYFISLKGDSILLSILDPTISNGFIIKERLIFFSDSISYNLDQPQGNIIGLCDFFDGHGKSLVFSISTGFSKQPRRIFRYIVDEGILKASPLSGVSVYNPYVYDLDMDSIPEIFFETRATSNYTTNIPFSDVSSWLMVLDNNLQFKFNPVEFKGYPSSIQVTCFGHNHENYMAVFHNNYGVDNVESSLLLYDQHGLLINSRILSFASRGKCYINSNTKKGSPEISILDAEYQLVRVYDFDLYKIDEREIPPLYNGSLIDSRDIDLDGSPELFFNGSENNSYVIFRDGITQPVLVQNKENSYPIHFSNVFRNGDMHLYTQYSDAGYISKYDINSTYYYRYLYVFAIYVGISLIFHLVFRIQKFQSERVRKTEKKISELQMLNLKNQIDPHFTFNIINSIGTLYSNVENKKIADDIFVKYSRFLQHTIRNSDNISVSIEEELTFVKYYIELEQLRRDYSFEYDFNIHDSVDTNAKIPRLLIHTFIENAIKHGLRMKENDGILDITITSMGTSIRIAIRDNGPGLLKKSEDQVDGTGKGLHIIDEMIELYLRLVGKRITYTLVDVSISEPKSTGTLAVIMISN